jgi:hypothetical protein
MTGNGDGVKGTPKWLNLGERVAKLKDGESFVLKREGDLVEEARKIRNGLNGINACRLVRRTVKVIDGKIVITRTGTWLTLFPERYCLFICSGGNAAV